MYNAFISYSHAADGKLAPALEKALQRFAIPWWKKRVLNIFRDEASLSASPHLWINITKALDESEYLIYMASPKSAKSKWVNQEIDYWLRHKSLDTLLIALTDGDISWDDKKHNFENANDNSLPLVLEERLNAEPFYIDLRPLKSQEQLSIKNPIFQKEVLKLAAQLHGKEPKDLASEELRAQRRWKLIRNIAFVLLATLLGFSVYKTFEANRNAIEATKQKEIATGQAKRAIASGLTASSNFYTQINPTLGFRLAEYALQFDSANTESYAALLRAFYSNPHYFRDKIHGSTFVDEETQAVSSIPELEYNEWEIHTKSWPLRFMRSKGIEIWGEFWAVSDVIYSPGRNFALFFYSPESDNAEYRIELWDLKNRFNKVGWQWNDVKQTYNDDPVYSQHISYTQAAGFGPENFSSDNKYLVVQKESGAFVFELPAYNKIYHGRFFDEIQFNVSSSNSQVIRTCFDQTGNIISTVDLKGDTVSFNLQKFALTSLPLRKADLYSTVDGSYVLSVQGKSAAIWDLQGTEIGVGTLNEGLNGFVKAPENIENWKQIKLKKVLSKEYYDSYVSKNK